MATLRLLTESHTPATFDAGVTAAVLARVASGALAPTLRLFTPGRSIAFGSQDRTRPGYRAAIAAAVEAGYSPIERLAGGKAAVFHEGTVAFAWATPEADSKVGIERRFRKIDAIVIDALRSLGVAAAVGEVPGEYCPGKYSVQAGGCKVMGVGQRLVAGAAHVGGVVVVNSPELVNLPLVPVYEALGYDWDLHATGAVSPDLTPADVAQALVASFRRAGLRIEPAETEPETKRLAEDLAPAHDPSIP